MLAVASQYWKHNPLKRGTHLPSPKERPASPTFSNSDVNVNMGIAIFYASALVYFLLLWVKFMIPWIPMAVLAIPKSLQALCTFGQPSVLVRLATRTISKTLQNSTNTEIHRNLHVVQLIFLSVPSITLFSMNNFKQHVTT